MSGNPFPRAAYIEARLDKWEDYRTPEDGAPDETVDAGGEWVNAASGAPITDPAHLDYLYAQTGKRNRPGPGADGGTVDGQAATARP
jgi:hypothetical protein